MARDVIRIESYNDGFMVDVFGTKFSWDHHDDHEVLKSIIEEIVYHTTSDMEVEYEEVY